MLQMIRHGAAKIFTDELQERLISSNVLKVVMERSISSKILDLKLFSSVYIPLENYQVFEPN